MAHGARVNTIPLPIIRGIPPNESMTEPSNDEHPEYFIDDEMVIFVVEQCYFKVHQYFLKRDSEIFRGLFMCPPGTEGPEGRTKESAISLPGVTKFEMTCLLRFLYHGMYDNYGWKTSVPEWTALLSISTRYAFDKIRDRAISALAPTPYFSNTLDPVEMVVLAVKHDIPQWLEPAYVLICMREESMDDIEGERLGIFTTIRLAKARERFWREQARMGENKDAETPGGLFGSAGLFGSVRSPCPRRARATQIVHEVFWPPSSNATDGAPR